MNLLYRIISKITGRKYLRIIGNQAHGETRKIKARSSSLIIERLNTKQVK